MIADFNAAIIEARARADTLAAPIIGKGKMPDAVEVDKVRGETAALIVELAEKRSRLVPATEINRIKTELYAYGKEAIVDIVRTMQREVSKGAPAQGPGPG